MKARFTNEEMDEAVVTKGILWWKQETKVHKVYVMWYHEDGTPVHWRVLDAIRVITPKPSKVKQKQQWRKPT